MDFADFMALIDARYIYDGGKAMAFFVASVITPFLLVIAIWLRLASNQLESATSGQGKWSLFFKDLTVWVTILGLYFVLAGFLSDIFNEMYSYFQERGSLGAILARFAEMIDDINQAGEEADLLSQSLSVLTSPVTFVVWLFYYFSFLVATVMIKFLKLAHAICWSFALVWGLVAIPMSITSNFKLLKGWAVFTGISLLWPIIHFGGFALFNPIFEHAANEFVAGSGAGLVSMDKAQLYLVMTVVNILAVAIAIAAPFITMSLVSNSGSIAGVVAPFASAAVATAAAAMSKARMATTSVGNAGGVAGKDMLAGRNPLSRFEDGLKGLKQSIMGMPSSSDSGIDLDSNASGGSTGAGFKPTASKPAADHITPATHSSQTQDTSRSSPSANLSKAATVAASSSGLSGPLESSSTEPSLEPDLDDKPRKQKKAQARRGAMINKLNKTPSTNR